jgi:hypothetical protein
MLGHVRHHQVVMAAAGVAMATVLAALIASDISQTAQRVRQVSLEQAIPRKQQLWIVPDNGVITTINTRGYENECVYKTYSMCVCVCVCVCVRVPFLCLHTLHVHTSTVGH